MMEDDGSVIIDDTRNEDIFAGDPDEEITQDDIDKLISPEEE